MAVQRKVSVKKYLIAFILTIVIFAGGITIGLFLEGERLNYAQQTILEEKVNLRSLQLQQKFIESGLAECKSLNKILESNINELSKKGGEIINYEKKSLFNQAQFKLQLQDYFLTEIQFLLLSQEIDEKCAKNNVKIIYFYDENELDTQGSILDYIKKRFGSKVLVFSLDSGFDEPMIKVLLTSNGINNFPSLVIEDKVLQGHQPAETIVKEICQEFSSQEDIPKACYGELGLEKVFKEGVVI